MHFGVQVQDHGQRPTFWLMFADDLRQRATIWLVQSAKWIMLCHLHVIFFSLETIILLECTKGVAAWAHGMYTKEWTRKEISATCKLHLLVKKFLLSSLIKLSYFIKCVRYIWHVLFYILRKLLVYMLLWFLKML